jgi:hypothetical protein
MSDITRPPGSSGPPGIIRPSVPPPIYDRYQRFFAWAGMVFIGLAFICILGVVILIVIGPIFFITISREGTFMDFIPHAILLVTGFISALIGRSLLTAGGRSDFSSLPPADYELISDAIKAGQNEPINQYIRVRALSGFTGGFTKIGLTGLPLVTIGVTMIFTLLALPFYGNEKIFTSFFDLAKLTLGAFIGSYVQRQVERGSQATAATVPGAPPASMRLPV